VQEEKCRGAGRNCQYFSSLGPESMGQEWALG